MTREENAIKVLESWQSRTRKDYAEYDVLDMAIAALREQEERSKAESEGRVIVLPCKIGDEVFCLRNRNGKRWEIFRGTVTQMYFVEDMRIGIYAKGGSRGEWGKEFFATREEAEAALEEKAKALLLKRKKEKNDYV